MQPRHHNSSAVEAAALGVFLLAYSNGLAAWALRQGKDTELTFRRLNPVLLMVLLVYAWFRRGGWARSGLSRKGLGKSLGWGTAVGALLAAPPALFFNNPVLLDGPLEYGPVARMTKDELLLDMFLRVPLSIASLEELSFRGLLYSALRARLSARASILWSALAFAGWHFTVTAATGK